LLLVFCAITPLLVLKATPLEGELVDRAWVGPDDARVTPPTPGTIGVEMLMLPMAPFDGVEIADDEVDDEPSWVKVL